MVECYSRTENRTGPGNRTGQQGLKGQQGQQGRQGPQKTAKTQGAMRLLLSLRSLLSLLSLESLLGCAAALPCYPVPRVGDSAPLIFSPGKGMFTMGATPGVADDKVLWEGYLRWLGTPEGPLSSERA